MTREEAIKKLKGMRYVYEEKEPNKSRNVALHMAIQALEQEPCEETSDTILIHTQGLEEGIRCAMCTNPIKSDRGCDGGCSVNETIYKKVIEVIDNQIAVQPMRKRGKWGGKCGYRTCSECGYSGMVTDDEGEWIPEFFCPNCGSQMEDGE